MAKYKVTITGLGTQTFKKSEVNDYWRGHGPIMDAVRRQWATRDDQRRSLMGEKEPELPPITVSIKKKDRKVIMPKITDMRGLKPLLKPWGKALRKMGWKKVLGW